jgi:hypothetical protein
MEELALVRFLHGDRNTDGADVTDVHGYGWERG